MRLGLLLLLACITFSVDGRADSTSELDRFAAVPAATDPIPHAENLSPRYPFVARMRGWEGKTVLQAHVAADGTVSDATVRTSSGHGLLDRAALEAVRAWTFEPATRTGRAVDTVVHVPIRFALED